MLYCISTLYYFFFAITAMSILYLFEICHGFSHLFIMPLQFSLFAVMQPPVIPIHAYAFSNTFRIRTGLVIRTRHYFAFLFNLSKNFISASRSSGLKYNTY